LPSKKRRRSIVREPIDQHSIRQHHPFLWHWHRRDENYAPKDNFGAIVIAIEILNEKRTAFSTFDESLRRIPQALLN
jgi:hypothetical protein